MSNQRKVVGIVAAIAAISLASPAFAQSAVRLTESGRVALTNRQFEAALTALDAALREDGAVAPAHYYRGIALANLGRTREALDAFLRATELNPGWGEAHRMAAIAAMETRNLPVAWDQAIKAHQAGAEVAGAVHRLLAMEKAPEDLDEQLAAVRVFVMPLDTEKLEARENNPWGTVVDAGGAGGGAIPDPFSTSAARATGVGRQQVAESQGDFHSLLAQTRRSLADSNLFGLVPSQEMAQFLLVIEVDEMGGGATQKPIKGYIKLYDARSGEEAYRRLLDLGNIASLADLNRDLERYVDYMEEWLRERSG